MPIFVANQFRLPLFKHTAGQNWHQNILIYYLCMLHDNEPPQIQSK